LKCRKGKKTTILKFSTKDLDVPVPNNASKPDHFVESMAAILDNHLHLHQSYWSCLNLQALKKKQQISTPILHMTE